MKKVNIQTKPNGFNIIKRRIVLHASICVIILMVLPTTATSDPDCMPCAFIVENCSENCSLSFTQNCNDWEYTIWCSDGYRNTWDGIGQFASGGNTVCGGVTPCLASAP